MKFVDIKLPAEYYLYFPGHKNEYTYTLDLGKGVYICPANYASQKSEVNAIEFYNSKLQTLTETNYYTIFGDTLKVIYSLKKLKPKEVKQIFQVAYIR